MARIINGLISVGEPKAAGRLLPKRRGSPRSVEVSRMNPVRTLPGGRRVRWLIFACLLGFAFFAYVQRTSGAIGQRWGARRTLVVVSALALVATLATAALPSILTEAALFVSLLAATLFIAAGVHCREEAT